MRESQKMQLIFGILNVMWLITLGIAIYFGNILFFLMASPVYGWLIHKQLNAYLKKKKYGLEYYPDSLPFCDKSDIELFIDFLNKNFQGKNILIGEIRYSFIITDEGKMTRLKINNKPKKIESGEIISILQNLREWTPSQKDGKNVNYLFSGGFDIIIDKDLELHVAPVLDSMKLIDELEKKKQEIVEI